MRSPIEKFIIPRDLPVGTKFHCSSGNWDGEIVLEDGIKKLHIEEVNIKHDLSDRSDGFYGWIKGEYTEASLEACPKCGSKVYHPGGGGVNCTNNACGWWDCFKSLEGG